MSFLIARSLLHTLNWIVGHISSINFSDGNLWFAKILSSSDSLSFVSVLSLYLFYFWGISPVKYILTLKYGGHGIEYMTTSIILMKASWHEYAVHVVDQLWNPPVTYELAVVKMQIYIYIYIYIYWIVNTMPILGLFFQMTMMCQGDSAFHNLRNVLWREKIESIVCKAQT